MTEVLSKRILPFALLALYAALSLGTILQKSATWDETHYLGLGAHLIRQNQWNVPSATLHPPLSYYLHSLPLLFCTLDQSCFERGRSTDILSGVRRGQCLMKNSDPSGDELLCLARVPMICIGVLLGWFVYSWASGLYGTGGGLMSLFLYCLSPNILAHTGLITPDLCLTAFGFIAIYFLWRNSRSPSIINLILGGFAFGLTFLSKYAGLIWVPVLVLLAIFGRLQPKRSPQSGTAFSQHRPLAQIGIVLLVAFFILLLGYQFDLSLYFQGIEDQRRIVEGGIPAFLNGKVSREGGWWYYYLFAFLIKLPIPTLILLVISAFTVGKMDSLARSSLPWIMIPVVVVFVAFSSLTQVNTGLRYVLPAFPFIFVFLGNWVLLWKKRKSLGALLPACLLLWYAAENLLIFPHYLAYFNQIAGGAKGGYRYLVDSNLDWGQDLKALRKYMEGNGIDTIKLSYFGTADPKQYDIDYETLPSFARLSGGRPPGALKKGDLVAISATNLYPLYVDLGDIASHLRSIEPLDRVGYSILIYKVEAF
jgi:hypothetical protein